MYINATSSNIPCYIMIIILTASTYIILTSLLIKVSVRASTFQDNLKDQFFPEQHGKLKSRVTNELPAASGLFCDIKQNSLK